MSWQTPNLPGVACLSVWAWSNYINARGRRRRWRQSRPRDDRLRADSLLPLLARRSVAASKRRLWLQRATNAPLDLRQALAHPFHQT